MSASAKLGTKIVNVQHERGKSGAYFATSPDIDGLIVSARSEEELEQLIPGAIASLYKACGQEVIVTKIDEAPADDSNRWAALPAELAKRKLEELNA